MTFEEIREQVHNGTYKYKTSTSAYNSSKTVKNTANVNSKLSFEQIRQYVSEGKYNFDYSTVDRDVEEAKRTLFPDRTTNSELVRAAAELAKNNASSKNTSMSYDEKLDALKDKKKEALKERIKTTASSTLDSIIGQITGDEEREKDAKKDYDAAKENYKKSKQAIIDLKNNEEAERQNEIEQLISNDTQISSLVEKAYSNREIASEKTSVAAGTDDLSTAILSLKGVSDSDYDISSQDKEINDAKEQLNTLLKEKGSSFNADDLISYYVQNQNVLKSQETAKAFEKAAKENPVETAVGRVLSAPYAAATNVATTVGDKFLNGDYIYNSANAIQDARRGIKSGVEQKAATSAQEHNLPFADKDINIFGNDFGNIYSAMYDAIDNGAENAYTSLLLGGGLTGGITAKTSAEKATQAAITAAFTSSTMGEETSELKANGTSIKDAYAQAGKNAIINFVTEMVGIPFLEGKGGVAGTVSSEALEEIVGNALSNLDDVIRLQDEGEIMSAYNNYISEGKSESEALSLTVKNLLADDIFSAGMAAFSSLGMAGTSAVSQRISGDAAYRAEGKAIQSTGNDAAAAVINEGLSQEVNSPAYKAATELLKMNTETDSAQIPKKVSNKKLGQLQQLNVQQNDITAFKNAVSDEENSDSLVKTFEKITEGKSIATRAAAEMLNNETARKTLNQLAITDNIDDQIKNGKIRRKKSRNILNEAATAYRAFSASVFHSAQPVMDSEQVRTSVNERRASQPKEKINKDITLSDGTPDTVTSVDSVKGDVVYLNTSNGSVVEASSVKFADEDTANLYKSAKAYSTNVAKTYVMGYTDNGYDGNVYDYNTGFNAVYMAQKQGRSLSDAINLAHEQGSHITDIQAQLAYIAAENDVIDSTTRNNAEDNKETAKSEKALNQGAQTANQKAEKFNSALNAKKTPGATIIADKNTLSKSQKAEVELLDSFAKSIDREIIIVDDTEELGYGAANGFYENGKIVLAFNADGGLMTPYLGHELFHDLKATSKVNAQQLEDFVIEHLKNDSNYNYDNRVEQLIELNNFKGTREQQIAQANEEIAANACFTVLFEKENFERLVKQDKSLAQKVRNFFADFIKKIKNALADISRRNAEYRALKDDITAKEKILEMFDEALDYSNEESNGNEDIKFSLNDDFDETYDFSNNINIVANMDPVIDLTGNEFKKNSDGIVAQVSKFFNTLGNKVTTKYGDVILDNKGVKSSLAHGLGRIKATAYKAVPSVLKHGEVINYSKNYNGGKKDRVVFAAPIKIDVENYFVAVVVEINKINNSFYLHEVALQNKKEDNAPFKTGSRKKSSPSGATSSIYSLLEDLQNVNSNFMQDETKNSLKEQPIDYNAILEENEELSEMNEDLKQLLELTSAENEKLKNEFKITDRHNISNNAVDKVAVELRKQYSSNYGKSELVSRLSGLYDYMANAGTDIDMGYVWNAASGIAKNIVANSQHTDTTIYDEYRELRNRIRSTQIRVPETVKNNFSDYDSLRRNNFGRLRLSDNGTELDSFYYELSSEYPEFFDTDVSEEQQLEALANFFEVTSPVYYNASEQAAESMGLNENQYTNLIASDIFEKYFDVPEVLTVAEKHKKEISALKTHYHNRINEMRQSYKDRYEERLREIKESNKQKINNLRESKAEALAKQKAHFEEVGKNASERRKKSKIRASIRRSLSKIASLGANPTKQKHIPNAIIDSVKALADAVTLDDTQQDQKLAVRLNEFKKGFEHISSESQYSVISELYNDYIQQKVIELQKRTGNTPLKQLSVQDLEEIDSIIKMTVQSINNINRLFLKGKNESIDKYAENIFNELVPYKKGEIRNGITKSLTYNTMKPEYFFRYIGSETLLDLYHELRKGEDTWAVDISEARNYALEIRNKYGWQKWDNKETQKFNTINGEIELTLQERLGIFANSLGEHTKNHLYGGGFVYQEPKAKGIEKLGKQRNDNSSHQLSIEDVTKIVNSLTVEQCSYVRDMIKYLSSDMAQKGNEITRELYDVDLFKESTYYPAKVNREATHQTSTEIRAEKQIKNAGFTNSAVQDAKQPLVLMDFDDVWASHVDEMSKYHAFVLPLENFDRVYNLYKVNSDCEYTSIKESIKNAYGNKALAYIDDLIKDINGGVVQEAGTDIISNLTSKFKKNAVFASASVAIQQPSAIGRALSEIDVKYFTKTTFSGFNRKSYEEMKKYAPVAIIKEMGYFDTNMAQSTVDFLNNNEYEGIKEKAKAFVKDGAYRDEVMSFFASKADEITWTHIWNACKAEIKSKSKDLTDVQMLEKARERFTEVITKTQVYDSVFSRSGLMRSRDSGVKNAMAFMAEPTTSLNMLIDATIQAKRGTISKAKAARVFGSLMVASVLNSLLQSVVTAARVDDDDKDWAEAYIAELIPNFIDNLNPLNQIAFVKDVFNIFKGYDVTRADMNLFSDLYDSIKKLSSDKITTTKKITGLTGAASAFFGIPAKNVIRDVESLFNVGKDFFEDNKFSKSSALYLFKEEMNSYLGFELFNSKLENAIKGIEKGDMTDYEEYADEIYASSDAYDLLYSVLKKYGYNSSQYKTAEDKCIKIKQENGAANPNPETAMKNRAIEEYAKAKKTGTYQEAEALRQNCIQLYGSMDNVQKALDKLEEKSENK